MHCTLWARASFHDAGSHRETPRFAEDGPGLIDDQDSAARSPAGDGAVQPAGSTGHEDAERGGDVDGGEVEGGEGRLQVVAPGGRAVEHAAEVAVAQAPEFKGRVPALFGELVPAHSDALGGLDARTQHGRHHPAE
jgi:hypothetical protein